ncbi:hypothetical protein P4C99_20090 [Pontiellaceae bacterium B1224]|nr:hypothetical protein [Pontiellaceae bacterium B1224]
MNTTEDWNPIELDESFTEQLGKMTDNQLRYLVCRLAFPEHAFKSCAEAAGYSQPSVRGSEQERKPIVRELLARCERKPRDAEGETFESMERDDLIRFHEGVIRDPRTVTREKQASARDLAELRQWIKGNAKQSTAVENMAELLESIGSTG